MSGNEWVVLAAIAALFAAVVGLFAEARARTAALKEFRKELNDSVSREVSVQVAQTLIGTFPSLRQAEEDAKSRVQSHVEALILRMGVPTLPERASAEGELRASGATTTRASDGEQARIQHAINAIAFAAQLDRLLPPLQPSVWVEELRKVVDTMLSDDPVRVQAEIAIAAHDVTLLRDEEQRTELASWLRETAKQGPFFYVAPDGTDYLFPGLSEDDGPLD